MSKFVLGIIIGVCATLGAELLMVMAIGKDVDEKWEGLVR